MEITSGIHRIDGVRGANSYLIVRTDGMLLIDTGLPRNTDKILNYVKKLNKKSADIKYIILTHADMDHIGNAAQLKKITGAKLVIHAGDAPILEGRQRQRSDKGFMRIAFLLAKVLFPLQPAVPDIILQNDFQIEDFQTIYTPGHTAGSICVYEPGKTIFTGDAVISDSKGNPLPPTKGLLSDLGKARESLNKIAGLEFDILLTGHGEPVIGQASQKVKEMLKNLR